MASIIKKISKEGIPSWMVKIRRKNASCTATFHDEGTAILWGKWKESLMHEVAMFDVPNDQLYTTQDIFTLKYGVESREYSSSVDYFRDIWEHPIDSLTEESMMDLCNKLLSTKIIRGGNAAFSNSGHCKYPTVTTILRKFSYFSGAINYVIGNCRGTDNPPLKIVRYLRTLKENPYDRK